MQSQDLTGTYQDPFVQSCRYVVKAQGPHISQDRCRCYCSKAQLVAINAYDENEVVEVFYNERDRHIQSYNYPSGNWLCLPLAWKVGPKSCRTGSDELD